MSTGTKSLLFGVHCFFLHPLFVAAAWWRLYGFPLDPRLWVAFVVHDWGYWGCGNMDGPEGEWHVAAGAKVMGSLFDHKDKFGFRVALQPWFTRFTGGAMDALFGNCPQGGTWYCFSFYHSRFMAKRYGVQFSRLCVADKLAIVLMPKWLALALAGATGELAEYMRGTGHRTSGEGKTAWQWQTEVNDYISAWVEQHKGLCEDTWTGTPRDIYKDRR